MLYNKLITYYKLRLAQGQRYETHIEYVTPYLELISHEIQTWILVPKRGTKRINELVIFQPKQGIVKNNYKVIKWQSNHAKGSGFYQVRSVMSLFNSQMGDYLGTAGTAKQPVAYVSR